MTITTMSLRMAAMCDQPDRDILELTDGLRYRVVGWSAENRALLVEPIPGPEGIDPD